MVDLRYRGELGDYLFQFLLGREIALRLGLELRASPIPGFFGTSRPVPGEVFLFPCVELNGFIMTVAATGEKLNFREVDCFSRCRLLLTGWFSRCEYLGSCDAITEVLDPMVNPQSSKRIDGLCICQQTVPSYPSLSELYNLQCVAPAPLEAMRSRCCFSRAEIQHLISTNCDLPICIFTDDVNHQSLSGLTHSNVEIKKVLANEGFWKALRFRRIAFSQNITYWWAAYLSRAEMIYPIVS